MKNLKTFETFKEVSNIEVNESIKFGSYYFNKDAFDGYKVPKKGETFYAVITHNTVEINKSLMYLRAEDDHIVGAGFRPKVLWVYEDEATAKAKYKSEVKEGGDGPNLSFSLGSIKADGHRVAYEEIEGVRKKLK